MRRVCSYAHGNRERFFLKTIVTSPGWLKVSGRELDPVPELLATLTSKRSWCLVWRDGAPVVQRMHEQEAQVEALCCWLNRQQEARG